MMSCVHGTSLNESCRLCSGMAEDAGWGDHDWRIVNSTVVPAYGDGKGFDGEDSELGERVAALERRLDERDEYEREQSE